ncbi:unnamed protein product [Commensalibacter papalotli (ex Botero et al. 2024)]|nr:unnamed protein product [Commensalibacter papalotli (ex Botero et al. 2024)]
MFIVTIAILSLLISNLLMAMNPLIPTIEKHILTLFDVQGLYVDCYENLLLIISQFLDLFTDPSKDKKDYMPHFLDIKKAMREHLESIRFYK